MLRPCCDYSQVYDMFLLSVKNTLPKYNKLKGYLMVKKKSWSSLKYCQNPKNTFGKDRCKTGLQLCLKEITATTNVVLI